MSDDLARRIEHSHLHALIGALADNHQHLGEALQLQVSGNHAIKTAIGVADGHDHRRYRSLCGRRDASFGKDRPVADKRGLEIVSEGKVDAHGTAGAEWIMKGHDPTGVEPVEIERQQSKRKALPGGPGEWSDYGLRQAVTPGLFLQDPVVG